MYIRTNCLMPFPSNCAHKYATLVVFGMQSKKEKYWNRFLQSHALGVSDAFEKKKLKMKNFRDGYSQLFPHLGFRYLILLGWGYNSVDFSLCQQIFIYFRSNILVKKSFQFELNSSSRAKTFLSWLGFYLGQNLTLGFKPTHP